MLCQVSADRRKNRSIQVEITVANIFFIHYNPNNLNRLY